MRCTAFSGGSLMIMIGDSSNFPYGVVGKRSVSLNWPLTGRAEEVRLIEASVAAPDVGGIVVCGQAGVGKSRIAREALATTGDRLVRWAVGTSSATAIPLGAFASWTTGPGDNLQLVRSVSAALTAAPESTTAVIAVDDAHLLDELSIFVLHQIVARAAAKVVLTVRAGETIPAGLQEVWAAGQFEWLDLQPLSRNDTRTVVTAALGGSLDPDAVGKLWRMTRGNMLYLRNILEQEVGQGRIAARHGVWQWSGEPVIPPSLVELIESRIGTLSAEVGDVVDTLAVGEPIELGSLRRITSPAAIEEADERGLITVERVDDRDEVRVAHPLYGEVRRRRAATTRLRRLRGLIVDGLTDCPDDGDARVLVRRAGLTLDSDRQPDPALFVRAAEGAVSLADLPLAERLADAAIRAGGGQDAYFVRAHALSWLSRGEEADAVLAAISTEGSTDALKARIVFLRAVNRLYAMADPRGAIALVDDASRTLGHDARNCLSAFVAVHHAAMGRSDAAVQASRHVAVDELPHLVGAVYVWGLTVAAGDTGRVAKAVEHSDVGYRFVGKAFDAGHMRFVIADAHVDALLQAGLVEEAEAVATQLHTDAADLPGPAQMISTAIAGRAALGAGRADVARSLLTPVVEVLVAAGDTNGWGYRYQLPLTIALAMCGSTAEAAAAVDSLDELRHPSWRFLDYEYVIAKAWVTARQGMVKEAIQALSKAAKAVGADGRSAAEVACLQVAAQFGDRTSGTRLRLIAEQVQGPRARVAARFAIGLRAGDGCEISAASHEFEAFGDLLAAADAAAHAASVFRRKNLRGSAYAASVRAADLAKQCGGVLTPATGMEGEQLPLTSREREIVMLLGDGLSSRAVAGRLTLSVRTVEGHIYRAMSKTGTTTREDLAALLSAQRDTPRVHDPNESGAQRYPPTG
jgi:DNA-binding CsgD family transcriptional regulator